MGGREKEKPGDVLAKYRRDAAGADDGAGAGSGIDVAETGGDTAFAAVRGVAPPAMLDLRLKTGDAVALPYSYLTAVEYDAGGTLRLKFVGHSVTLTGRNLRRVYDGLVQHRVRYVQEESALYDESPETGTFIDGIVVKAAGADEGGE